MMGYLVVSAQMEHLTHNEVPKLQVLGWSCGSEPLAKPVESELQIYDSD
jgi:hypothetical protein